VQFESADLKRRVDLYKEQRYAAIARLTATDPELKAINESLMSMDPIAERLKVVAKARKDEMDAGNAPEESDTVDNSALSIKSEESSDDDDLQVKQEPREMVGLEQAEPVEAIPAQTQEILTRGNRSNRGNGKRKRDPRPTRAERQEPHAKRQRLENSMGNYPGTGLTRIDQPNGAIEEDQHERQPVVKVEMEGPNIMVIEMEQEEPTVPVKMKRDENYAMMPEERDEPQSSMDVQHGCPYCVGPCVCFVPL
jgi:hypothetical protein